MATSATLVLPGVDYAPRGDDDSDRQMTTPLWLVEMVTEFYGRIGIDPCWNEESFVRAAITYDGSCVAQDGLTQPWRGRAFVNPPYSDPTPWADRCALHAATGEEALLLVNVSLTVAWWRRWRPKYLSLRGRRRESAPEYARAVERARLSKLGCRAAAVAFFDRRIAFIKDGVERRGNPREQMLVYWGPRAAEFTRIFQRCGWVP